MNDYIYPPECQYCEERNSVLRYDSGGSICVKCGLCCERNCLEMADHADKFNHDYALKIMDGMFSEYYESKKRNVTLRDDVFRKYEEELIWNDRKPWLTNYLPSVMDTIAQMMRYKKGYFQNGKWRKF